MRAEPLAGEFCNPLGGPLAAGDGPHDQKAPPRRNDVGQWGIRQLMGQIVLGGDETVRGS